MKKIVLLVCVTAFSFAQKPIFTTAKVKAATVYFNAAELTQTASLNLPAGTSEVVIKNVANYLNESTVKIGAPNSVTVMSVQFTDDYISEYELDETNPVIKKVRDSITFVEKDIKKVQINILAHQQAIAVLDQNNTVGGTENGLKVDELIKYIDYYKNKRAELDNTIETLKEKEVNLNKKLATLNSKLEISSQKEEQMSSGKLVIQVMNSVAGSITLDINYVTNNASWSPFYELRADSVKDPINMMYKANVVQNTGVDWRKVKLTLSSGNPNQNNTAPILNAWFLRYGNNYSNFNNGYLNQIQGKVSGLNVKKGENDDKAEKTVASSISDYTTINENQLNVSFDIDIPYDIMSNGKAHSVALKEIKLPAHYKYYAAPRVDKDAFLLAEIDDYSKYNLLPGEANIVFEDLYVGKTYINPNQTQDTLNLSMGRDKKIFIKREKVVDKSGTKFLSGYKEQTFTYDITIRNNKKETVEMLLKDQYPISTDKEITIEVLDDGKASVNQETGIMTWQLKLNSNETKKIRISYLVKYPKDKIIDNL